MAKDLGEAVLRIRIQLDKFDADTILKKLDPLKDGLAKFAQQANAAMTGLVGQGGSLTKLANDLSTVAAALQQIKNASNVLKPLAQYQKAMQGGSGGGFQIGGGAKEFLSELNRVDLVITALLKKQANNAQGLSVYEQQTLKAAEARLRVLQQIDARKPGLNLGELGEKQVKELNKILSLFDKMPRSIEDTKARLKLLAEASNDWSKTFLPQSTIDRLRKAGEQMLALQEKAEFKKSVTSLKALGDVTKKVENNLTKILDIFNNTAKGPQRLDAATAALKNQFDNLIKTQSKSALASGDYNKALKQVEDTEKRLQAVIAKSITDTDLRTRAEKALRDAVVQREKEIGTKSTGATSKKVAADLGVASASRNSVQMREAIKAAEAYYATLVKGAGASKKEVEVLVRAIQRAKDALNQTVTRETSVRLENIRQAFQSVSSGVAQVGEQIRRVSFILRDVGRQMLTFGKAMVGFIQPNIDAFAQFEQGVVDILAITGNLREGFEETGVVSTGLAKQILELAASSRFSSAEIAEAAKTLALAGFTLDQIQGSLKSLTTLAAATGASLAEAANIVVSTMTTFQVEAEESARIADIFTAAVTRSNTNLNKLQESLKVVAPTAASMGQEIQGTVAALSSLANAGIKGCFDPLTEVLTERGWIKWEQANINDTFATVNQESNNLEWQKPVRMFAYHHEGDMYKVKTKFIDMLVTPNHNMFVSIGGGKFGLKHAEEMPSRYKLYNAPSSGPEDVSDFILPSVEVKRCSKPSEDIKIPMDQWLQFLGAYMSEGWCRKMPTKGHYTISVAQKTKSKGFEKYSELFENLPIPFGYVEKLGRFIGCSQQLREYLMQFGSSALTKKCPEFIKTLSQRQIRLFLDYYRLGDGTAVRGKNGTAFNIFTSSAKMADGLCELGVLAGYRTSVNSRFTDGGVVRGRKINSTNPIYDVSFCESQTTPVSRKQIHTSQRKQVKSGKIHWEMFEGMVPYSGMVYCAEVPNHTLIVRRNGKIHVSGNSSAGTGLSRIMTQLVEKSGKLDVMLRALGSSFDEIDPEKVGIVDIIKKFEELNLSTAQLLEIFDLRAFRSFQAIMQQGADSVALLNEQLLQSSNIAEKIAGLRLKTLAASMELLGDAVNALRVRLGELISKEFKFLVDVLAKVTESVTELAEKYKDRFAQFVKILASFAAVALTLGTALFGIGSAASFAAVPFIALGSILTTISAIVTGAITYIVAAKLTIAALLPIITTITLAFVALSIVVTGLTAAFVGTFAAIAVAVSQNFEMLISYVQSWSALFYEMGSGIISSFLRGWNLGKIRIMESFQALLNQLTSMGLGFKADFSSLLSDGAESFATGLTILFSSILDGITALLKALDESRPAFAAAFEALSQLFSALGGIAGFISMLDWFADLSEVLKAISGTIGILLLPALGALVYAFGPILIKLALISAAILALSALFNMAVGWGEAIRGFFTGSVVDSKKALEDLNVAIEENNRLMADLRKSAEETASIIKSETAVQLKQVDILIESLREADKTLKDLSGSSSSSIAEAQEVARDAISGELDEQIDTLTKTRDAITLRVREINGMDSQTAGPIVAALEAQEKAMTERIDNLTRLGKSLEKTNSIVTNSIKEGGKGAEQELSNLLAQKDIYDQIFEDVSNASMSIGDENVFEFLKENNDEAFQSLQKLTDQINIEFKGELEKPLTLDSYEDYIKLLEFTQKNVAGASQSTQEYITQVQALLPVLEKMRAEFPEFSELDFGDPKNREKFLEFLNKARGMMGEQIKQALEQEKKKEELLEIDKKLSESQLNTFQKAIKAHKDEVASINEKIEAQKLYLKGQETSLKLELQRTTLTEEQRKQKEAELKATQEAMDENSKMATNAEAAAAKEKEEINQDFEDKRTQNREAILEKELETTTDIQKRIELRREIMNSKEERDRRKAIKELEDNYDLQNEEERKLFEQEKKRLDSAWEASKQKNLQNMEDEENKKTTEDVNKMAEKRVDLEQEIVNNFAKQVTSLGQMAQLMIFIEKLQKRRVGLARKAMEEQIKAERDFAETQAKAAMPGKAGDLARKALNAKRRRAEFAAGAANAAAAQAGVQGGAAPLDQAAFFNQFMIGLNAMIDKLKANPIVIPAIFDTDSMIKDLIKKLKDAKIKISASLPIDPGAGGGNRLAGVNLGTIINHDNSTVNINTSILSPQLLAQFTKT